MDIMELNELIKQYDFLSIDLIPGAEGAVVPLNPNKWLFHYASGFSAKMAEVNDYEVAIKAPFSNINSAKEYVLAGKDFNEVCNRVFEVGRDTAIVNALAETSEVSSVTPYPVLFL